ncbi:MAG: hypothetical protein KF819_20000 [Labilithrix sp.]|nr:hypothetical protein [Labilithrix sp.]
MKSSVVAVAALLSIASVSSFASRVDAKEADAKEPDEIVEIVEDDEAKRPVKKPERAPEERPDQIAFRGFTRLTLAAGMAAREIAPAGAPSEERVGYDRGALTTHTYLDVKYSRGKTFQAVLSGSLAYGGYLAESRPGYLGAERKLESGRVEPVLREAYVGIYGEHVDLRLGQQRIVWGAGGGLAPNDVLNARDVRNRMQLDQEMIDLPTPAVRADFDLGVGILGVVVQPFFVPDRLSLYGGNWSLVQPDSPRSYRRLFGLYAEDRDRNHIDDAQAALVGARSPSGPLDGASIGASFKVHAGKLDTSFYYHWGRDRTPYIYLDPAFSRQLEIADPDKVDGLVFDAFQSQQKKAEAAYGGPLVIRYYRRHHVGFDATTTAGPLVLRADASYDTAMTFFSQGTLNSVARGAAQGVVGMEYQRALDKVISVEAWYMRLVGPEMRLVPVLDPANRGPLLFSDENNVGVASLVRWSFFENLVFETRSFVGVSPTWYMVRPEIGYNAPSFTVRVGLLLVDGERGSFGGVYGRNDTAYVTARHSF